MKHFFKLFFLTLLLPGPITFAQLGGIPQDPSFSSVSVGGSLSSHNTLYVNSPSAGLHPRVEFALSDTLAANLIYDTDNDILSLYNVGSAELQLSDGLFNFEHSSGDVTLQLDSVSGTDTILNFQNGGGNEAMIFWDDSAADLIFEVDGGARMIMTNSIVNVTSGTLRQGGTDVCLESGTNCDPTPDFENVDIEEPSGATYLTLDAAGSSQTVIEFQSANSAVGLLYYDPPSSSLILGRSGGGAAATVTSSVFNISTGTLQQGGVDACLEDGTNCDEESDVENLFLNGCTVGTAQFNVQWNRNGNIVTLYSAGNSCTSNSTSFSSTGSLPAAIRPTSGTRSCPMQFFVDGGTTTYTTGGSMIIQTDGTMDFRLNQSATAWTNSSTKGVGIITCTYLVAHS